MKKHNAHTYRRPDGEVFILPSLTVPDMTISLRQLVDNQKVGKAVKVFSPVYDPNGDIPIGLERMDKIERAELARNTADFIKDQRGRLITAKQKLERDAYDAKLIAEHEAKMKARTVPDVIDSVFNTDIVADSAKKKG